MRSAGLSSTLAPIHLASSADKYKYTISLILFLSLALITLCFWHIIRRLAPGTRGKVLSGKSTVVYTDSFFFTILLFVNQIRFSEFLLQYFVPGCQTFRIYGKQPFRFLDSLKFHHAHVINDEGADFFLGGMR